eukprot:TRINITY_DN32326_c0_g1_i3.p1 TRINITY_DN32326_c0_g1~~TRINITY_DN32326_c0_g1_i3.p1  ORF type:complete len:311 (+),score=56.21 TRINITY_DN32326_c0_g1_i3:23-934(+)
MSEQLPGGARIVAPRVVPPRVVPPRTKGGGYAGPASLQPSSFEVRHVMHDGNEQHGVFATADIRAGEEILREFPMLEQEGTFVLMRPELEYDPECQALRDELEVLAEKFGDEPEGPDKYPPEVRAIIDRLSDRGHALTYDGSSLPVRAKFAALSSNEPMLNGRIGVATEFDGKSWAVRFPSGELTSIDAKNLRTPGGLWRTNAFESVGTGTQCVFEKLSRINHACVPNVRKLRSRATGEFVIFAKKDIKPGEELFIDYGVPPGDVEARRKHLEWKWNFTCHCQACEAGWVTSLDEAESQRIWC